MFMTSKVQLLWRDVERARRIADIQGDMDPKDVWAKVPVCPTVKNAEDRFSREMLFVYPELMEYCFEMEKLVYEKETKIEALQHELNSLKEVPTNPKKPRKKRAKKVKE